MYERSLSFLFLNRAGERRSICRDFYLLVNISEMALRFCQAWEKKGSSCSGHALSLLETLGCLHQSIVALVQSSLCPVSGKIICRDSRIADDLMGTH